jgi:hypothetical protein
MIYIHLLISNLITALSKDYLVFVIPNFPVMEQPLLKVEQFGGSHKNLEPKFSEAGVFNIKIRMYSR